MPPLRKQWVRPEGVLGLGVQISTLNCINATQKQPREDIEISQYSVDMWLLRMRTRSRIVQSQAFYRLKPKLHIVFNLILRSKKRCRNSKRNAMLTLIRQLVNKLLTLVKVLASPPQDQPVCRVKG